MHPIQYTSLQLTNEKQINKAVEMARSTEKPLGYQVNRCSLTFLSVYTISDVKKITNKLWNYEHRNTVQ